MRDDFAIFILSHGRADNVKTLKTLQQCNYTGRWYIVIDNEDKQEQQYYDNFGKDKVIKFNKLEMSKRFDTCDLECRDRKAIVYARNVCFDIAKYLKINYFLELDDDYIEFRYRYEKDNKLSSMWINDFDGVCEQVIEFLEKSNALTVAFAQTGDLIAGLESPAIKKGLLRKAMNSFFCKTSRRFDFIGRINEDVNTYTLKGTQGELMFTIGNIVLNQGDTQQYKGGMSDMYLDSGTYVKSFYTVIVNPSCCKIGINGVNHKRIHHSIAWENCCPKILNERWKK